VCSIESSESNHIEQFGGCRWWGEAVEVSEHNDQTTANDEITLEMIGLPRTGFTSCSMARSNASSDCPNL